MSQNSTAPDKMSQITLKTYVDLLRRSSRGELPTLHGLNHLDDRACRELLKSGLLSDDPSISDVEKHFRIRQGLICITPEGIAALEAWGDILKKKSLWHKAGENILRLLWLVVGAILASVPRLI